MRGTPSSPDATTANILSFLRSKRNPRNIEGMARFGISATNTLGVPMPLLRALGRSIGTNHAVALRLWKSNIHEARILATLVADPELLTVPLMERWLRNVDSWDICDQYCMNLLRHVKGAGRLAVKWSKHPHTFTKRAGFVVMAQLAVHDKDAADAFFDPFLARIHEASDDERPMVAKAINWALRQIGKRNRTLQHAAICEASRLASTESRSARWIGNDALRELKGPVAHRVIERRSRKAKGTGHAR